VAVIDHRSLTVAARRLHRSLQSVSRSLAALERSVGVELVRRTTRRVEPTEAGLAFYDRVKQALAALDEAKLEVANLRAEPTGVLRIAAPVLFAPTHLFPVITAFMERYPKIEIDLKLSDRFVDLIDEGIDVAVRIGELPDSSLKAKRLGELRRVVFGAPNYFERRGYPKHPSDLEHHDCVVRVSDRPGDLWPFRIGGKAATVKVKGRFRADNTMSTYAAVAEGIGLGFTPLWQITDLVDRGIVEPVLVEFEAPTIPIQVVWHASRVPLAKSRLFIDFLATRLECKRL
jgi:DNA-binding transcriptional LysR family regulator